MTDYTGPYVFPTVDIAIWRNSVRDPSGREWLFVKKATEPGWRFCGGFVDVADESLDAAAMREAFEETQLKIGTVRYVGSFRVDDPRFREKPNRIMTTLFYGLSLGGEAQAGDDVAETHWVDQGLLWRDGKVPDIVRDGLGEIDIVREHHPLLTALARYIRYI